MSDLPPALGGYDIASLLGEGGSGTVYEARKDGHEVALKVLRGDQTASARERKRWLGEAGHLGRIRHPGVVRVFDAGVLDDGRPFLVMERLHGQTLAERIAAGPVPLDRALELFDQLASAVTAIHDAGLIHRDLKPENVMLVDGGDRLVVLDLGIARPADAPPSTTTRVGYQRGTPAVMAPERFFGERATLRSDVYELGVILFVMLTGSLPWRAILDAQARLNPLRPSELGVTLPPAMEQALMRALASDAADRPASVAELADAIRQGGWSGPTLPAGAAQADPNVTTGATGHASDGLEAATAHRDSTEVTGGRASRWVLRIALVAGLALIATPVAIAVLDRDEPAQVAGTAADAAPAEPIALPEAVVAVSPPDAAAAQVAASTDAGVSVVKQRPPAPKHAAASRPVRAADAGAPAATAGAMPWCRKQAAIYCTDEFKATEGGLAGKLCDTMTEQVRKWETYPPQARASLEQTCEQNHDALAAAAAERIRIYQAGGAPGTPPP